MTEIGKVDFERAATTALYLLSYHHILSISFAYTSRLLYNDSILPERLDMLQKHREYVLKQLRKWNEYLQNLDDKIAFYQKSMREAEWRRQAIGGAKYLLGK